MREAIEEANKPYSGIIDVQGEVLERNGQFFISSHDVCRSGYVSTVRPDTVVRISENLYEVGGYSDSRREYWLLPLNLDVREAPSGSTEDDVYV